MPVPFEVLEWPHLFEIKVTHNQCNMLDQWQYQNAARVNLFKNDVATNLKPVTFIERLRQ